MRPTTSAAQGFTCRVTMGDVKTNKIYTTKLNCMSYLNNASRAGVVQSEVGKAITYDSPELGVQYRHCLQLRSSDRPSLWIMLVFLSKATRQWRCMAR
jgi:hypothetical protein